MISRPGINFLASGSYSLRRLDVPSHGGLITELAVAAVLPKKTMPSPSSQENSLAKRSPALSDAERWVDEYGNYLFKFAVARLRDESKAEDAVQETFLAALKGNRPFQGRSAEKTWLTGILKNKIYDYFRKSTRETSFTDLQFYDDEESDRFVNEGLGSGGWIHGRAPQEWASMGESLDNDLFWKTYHDCAECLPERVRVVFNLRELDGLETKELCAMLHISESNLWVMLHRARMALRRCLETKWFGKVAK